MGLKPRPCGIAGKGAIMERIKKMILLGLPLTEREKAEFLLFYENETLAEWAYMVLNIGE